MRNQQKADHWSNRLLSKKIIDYRVRHQLSWADVSRDLGCSTEYLRTAMCNNGGGSFSLPTAIVMIQNLVKRQPPGEDIWAEFIKGDS